MLFRAVLPQAHLSKGEVVALEKEVKQGHRTLLHRSVGPAWIRWLGLGLGPTALEPLGVVLTGVEPSASDLVERRRRTG